MGYPTTTHSSSTGSEDLDFLVTSLRKGDEQDVLQRLQRFVIEAATHLTRTQYETESSLNYQYIENDFYTDAELAEFAQRGQPPTKRNELAPIMERLAGQFIQTRQVASFLGRNTPADDQAGQFAQDYQRWNDQQNTLEFEEQDLAWDGLIGGVGWLKSWMVQNDLGQMVERTRHVNPYHIFKDPYSTRYNPNEDAKYICEGSWMDLEDAIALFPEQEEALRQIQTGSAGAMPFAVSSNIARSLQNEFLTGSMYALSVSHQRLRHRVRPFEVWYKRKVRLYHVMTDTGVLAVPVPLDSRTAKAIVAELGDRVHAEPTFQDRLYCGVFLASLLIHHDVSPHQTNLFPYTPFYSGMRKNGAPLPLCSRLVPINDAINKRESKALSLLTNNKIIAEKSAIEDPDAAQEENAKPDGFVEVRDGALSGNRILFHNNLEIGQAQLALLQEDKDAMRRVSGQGNESMGMPSEVRSGVGIARKQMMGALITMPVQNNLRRTRHMKATLSFALMKQYVTEEMAFQITDDPNAARTVTLTRGVLQALKERTYDIVVTEIKDYAVVREQQAEMLLTVLPQLAQLGPGMVKVGIQLTDLRDKEGLIKLVDAMHQPQPVQPKLTLAMSWPDLTPEMQAYLAMISFQSPELAQAIMHKGEDPAFVQKIKAELAKTLTVEGTRATVERGRLDLSALQSAVEGRVALRKILSQGAPETSPAASPMDQGATA